MFYFCDSKSIRGTTIYRYFVSKTFSVHVLQETPILSSESGRNLPISSQLKSGTSAKTRNLRQVLQSCGNHNIKPYNEFDAAADVKHKIG